MTSRLWQPKEWLVRAGRILGPGFWLLLAWVVLFQLFRVILVVATWSHHGDATVGILMESFWHGLRFDAAVAGRVLLLFILWKVWRPRRGRIEQALVVAVYSLVGLLSIFALVVEVEFYKEFQMRLNSVVFEYFSFNAEHNAIIAGMIWHGYPVVRWGLVCLVAWGLLIWITLRIVVGAGIETSVRAKLASTAGWIAVAVIASRGGLQGTVLRWGDAVFSQSTYANQMAENGVYALMDAVRHSARPSRMVKSWKRALPLAQAVGQVRQTTLLRDEVLVDQERFALMRTSGSEEQSERKKAANVVVILMESFSARFCGATGAAFGATPHFDELARQGILFDRAFSVGTHTAQGVFGTLCSLPSLPEFEGLMKIPAGRQKFRSLPAILNEAGFETMFLYNGLFSWDNKEGFFRNQGMKRFIGRADYKAPTFLDPDWGVCDFDVFMRAVEEFDALEKDRTPFLGVILTLSNHAPFNLPVVPGLDRIEMGGEQNQRLNGVRYADWALGQFFDKARRTRWFEETLFVLVGDHGFGIPPNLTDVNVLHTHVPLLFYGPGVLGRPAQVNHTVASQLDVLPTVLGRLGLKAAHESFGRDLFELDPKDTGHALVKRSGSSTVGWIEGDWMAVVTPGLPATLHRLDLGFPPSASPDLAAENPEQLGRMKRAAESFVSAGYATLERRMTQ